MMWKAFLAMGLLVFVLLIAGAIGRKALHRFDLEGLTSTEQMILALPLGLGALAYGVFLLGVSGLLYPWTITAMLAGVSLWLWPEWVTILGILPGWVKAVRLDWQGWTLGEKFVGLAGLMIGLLCLLIALTPPIAYDALMYHLQGPRLFLESGEIELLPDIWQANGPFTVEMLFTIGLALGSDVFPNLIHLCYAVLLILATFSLVYRYFSRNEAWLASAILLGMPTMPLWAAQAYIDIAWALYEFLALYALLLWLDQRKPAWLVVAGIMMGFALGSKYLSLTWLAILVMWLLWQMRGADPRSLVRNILLFGLPAVLVGLPWYIKNWVLAGNPLYPFLFGGPGWDASRLEFLMEFLRSFGTGGSVKDLLLLPWNIYINHQQFSTNPAIEILSPLYPLIFLSPGLLLGNEERRRRIIAGLLVITMASFLLWFIGSQQIRFLLPQFPLLSILTACVIKALPAWLKRESMYYVWQATLVGSMVIVTLIFTFLVYREYRFWDVLIGRESRDVFLRRMLEDYPAQRYVLDTLQLQERALLVIDARGYYCDERCLITTDHYQWVKLLRSSAEISPLSIQLHQLGVTHIFISQKDEAFMLKHDPTGEHQRASVFFDQWFLPKCAREVYRDQAVQIYRITCP